MADNSVKHTEFSGDGQAAMGKNTTNGSTSSSWSAVSSTTICSNSVIVSTKEESGGSPCDDRVVDVAVARDEPVVETVTSERQDDLFHGVALVIKEHLEGEKGLEVLSISANRSRTQEDAFKRLMKKGKTTRGAAEEIGLSSPTLDDLDGGRRLMAVVTEVKLTGLFRQPVTYKTWIEYRKRRTSRRWIARIQYQLLLVCLLGLVLLFPTAGGGAVLCLEL